MVDLTKLLQDMYTEGTIKKISTNDIPATIEDKTNFNKLANEDGHAIFINQDRLDEFDFIPRKAHIDVIYEAVKDIATKVRMLIADDTKNDEMMPVNFYSAKHYNVWNLGPAAPNAALTATIGSKETDFYKAMKSLFPEYAAQVKIPAKTK